MTVAKEEATANYVPAAAVIRRWQALSGKSKTTYSNKVKTEGVKTTYSM